MESRGYNSARHQHNYDMRNQDRHLYNYDVRNDRCCNNANCSLNSYDVTNNYHDNNFMCNRIHYNYPRREIPRYENRPHHVTEHVTSSRVGGKNLKFESSFESGQLAKNKEPLFESRSKLTKNFEQNDRTNLRFSFVY